MKLNTLLLSSAAVLVAGSAFAADLPSKKAAPAAAVTACKVGDTTGFTLPGGDTCLKLSGRVTYDISKDNNTSSKDGKADIGLGFGYRLNFDALTNTEIGVVRSFIRIDNSTTNKAFIQFAGLTAGKKDSLTDVYGTTGNQNPIGGNGGQGIDYRVNAGDFSLAVGLEDGVQNNASGSDSDNRDIVAQISGKAGPLTVKLGAASHQSYSGTDTHDGYAVKGSIAAALGQFNVIGFGGTAKGAAGYVGPGKDGGIDDLTGSNAAESTAYGAEINATFGKLLVAVQAANYETKQTGATTEKVTELDVYASYTLAKGLNIQPEYRTLNYTGGTSKDSNTAYLRIQRDF